MNELTEKEKQDIQNLLSQALTDSEMINKEIADLEQRLKGLDYRRRELDRTIWLARLALRSEEGIEKVSVSAEKSSSNGQFTKMSVADASEVVLKLAGRMMTARELFDALVRGGKKFTGKHPLVLINTSLQRDSGKRFFKRLYDGKNKYGLVRKETQ